MIKGGTRTDPRPYRPRPRWKFSFHTYQPQPGFPKEATSTRPDLLRTPKGTGSGHRLTANKWLHQRSQLGLTLVSSQTLFACTHSDELCEVTRGARLKGRLLYSPRRQLDYGFRLKCAAAATDWSAAIDWSACACAAVFRSVLFWRPSR